jgi:hypothetical protein
MSLVTGFESQSPEADGGKELNEALEFDNLYNALMNARNCASDVFAGWAKRAFRSLLKNHLVMATTVDRYPRWTAQGAVSFRVDKLEDRKAVQDALEGLVRGLAGIIRLTCKEEKSLMLNALTADIMMTGEFEITFRLKQRWGEA